MVNIRLSNWWILWFILFVLVTAALDTWAVSTLKCSIPFGKFTLYIARNIVELFAGAMGIGTGYFLAKKPKKKKKPKVKLKMGDYKV